MKKIFVLAALLVFALTLGVSAEKTAYWDSVLDTAQIEYVPQHGEISYYIQPFEFDNGMAINDGVENELYFHYGLAPKTQVNAALGITRGLAILSGNLQHQVVNKNGFAFALRGQLDYNRFDEFTPSVALLFDNNVGRQLQFHNNVTFSLYNSGNIGIDIENGLYYHLTPKSSVKANLRTYFTNLDNIDQNLKIAYRNHLTSNLNYTLVYNKNFNSTNHHFENIFEYKPVKSLKLTGGMVINTNSSNWILLRADKAMNNNFTVIGEFQKELVNNGYSYIKTGVNFKF